MRILTWSLVGIVAVSLSGCTSPEEAMSDQGVELVTYNFDYEGSASLQSKGYYALLTGSVKNNSEKNFGSVWLQFDVFDGSGNRLGTVRPNTMVGTPAIQSLGPGETWSFTFEISGYAGRARSARVLEIEARE